MIHRAEFQPYGVTSTYIRTWLILLEAKYPVTSLSSDMSHNNTTSPVGWVPEPQGRGTIGLLWSCFATIFLCTWNAIHPNLPGKRDSKFRVFRRRFEYFIGCLITPEWFTWLALDEHSMARRVQAKA